MSALHDREILDRAARALSWRLVGFDGATAVVVAGTRTFGWRPLHDDGEALRLAVDLDLELYQSDDEGRAAYAGYWNDKPGKGTTRSYAIEYHDDLNNRGDAMRAMRRAIVRAAAATEVRK
jgi:hypothetical protein